MPPSIMPTTLETSGADEEAEVVRPDVSGLVTHDDTPVEDLFHEKQMRLLTHSLYAAWKPGEPFITRANVGVFFAVNIPPMVPDVLVTVGVEGSPGITPKERSSYFVWLCGKVPDIVVEIVCNRKGGELSHKKENYAWHGIPYYVVYDPDLIIQDRKLRCFHLVDKAYEPMKQNSFPLIGLGLVEWDGLFEDQQDHWIRWVDASGTLIPTGMELAASSSRQAQIESRRAEALAAKLRELGVDPDSVVRS